MKKIFLVVLVAVFATATSADAQVLYDNGTPDAVNGYSTGTVDSIGVNRFLLDDFTITDGDGWTINAFNCQSVWGTPGGGAMGTEIEMEFYADAAGTPDVGGGALATINQTGYNEFQTGDILFSREVVDHTVEFDPINLGPGTYWFRARIIGPENNFWLTAGNGVLNGSECWVDYVDEAGLQTGTAQFGVASELTWAVLGEVGGGGCAFELGDVNQDGAVDLLDVAPFVDALTMGVYICEGDVNEDGVLDLLDVTPFVELLTGG